MKSQIKSNVAAFIATAGFAMLIGWIWESNWRWAATGGALLLFAAFVGASGEREKQSITRALTLQALHDKHNDMGPTGIVWECPNPNCDVEAPGDMDSPYDADKCPTHHMSLKLK